MVLMCFFFFSSRRRHTRYIGDWSSDVCSSDLDHRIERLPAGFDQMAGHVRQQSGGSGPGGALGQRKRGHAPGAGGPSAGERSEERRVGKECRARWWRGQEKRKGGGGVVTETQ